MAIESYEPDECRIMAVSSRRFTSVVSRAIVWEVSDGTKNSSW